MTFQDYVSINERHYIYCFIVSSFHPFSVRGVLGLMEP